MIFKINDFDPENKIFYLKNYFPRNTIFAISKLTIFLENFTNT